MTATISLKIESLAWVREENSYMNIPAQFKSCFPDNCFIARGTGKENQHLLVDRGIELAYDGSGIPVRCFLELRNSGKFRPSNRGAIKAFYLANDAQAGDTIVFTKLEERLFKVELKK